MEELLRFVKILRLLSLPRHDFNDFLNMYISLFHADPLNTQLQGWKERHFKVGLQLAWVRVTQSIPSIVLPNLLKKDGSELHLSWFPVEQIHQVLPSSTGSGNRVTLESKHPLRKSAAMQKLEEQRKSLQRWESARPFALRSGDLCSGALPGLSSLCFLQEALGFMISIQLCACQCLALLFSLRPSSSRLHDVRIGQPRPAAA